MKEKVIGDYILIGGKFEDFALAIKRQINKGWQPFGSPFMDNNGKKKSQAMVKYKED